MGALVGALRAMLTLDSTAFVSGVNKADKSKKKLEKGLIGLQATMKKFALGIAVAGGALAVAIKGQLNAADEMGKAAQKFGVGVEELSRLKYAADLSDVSLETLGTSLRTLSKKMVEAAKGGKSQTALFAEIGVAVTDASGKLRSTEVVLQDVSDVIAGMPDGAEKTALAMKLFGKAGTEMIPLLNGGKSALQQMADEATRLGVVIDTKTAKSAEAFNDNLTRLKAAAGGLVTQIAAALAPMLEKLSGWAVDAANAFGQLSPETKEMVVQLGTIFAAVAGAAVAFGLLSFAISPVSVTIGAIAAAAFLIKENWGPISAWFSEQWATIRTATEDAWAAIKDAIGGAIDWAQGKWDTFVASLKAAVQIAKDVGTAISEALTIGEAAGAANANRFGGLGGAAGAAVSGGSGAGSDAADGLVDGFVNKIIERQPEIDAAALGITDRVKAMWQINSPSKVFQEIGGNLTEGLALGIKDGVPQVDAAMGEVGDATETLQQKLDSFKGFSQGLFTGLVTGATTFTEALANLASKFAEMLANKAFEQLFGGLFDAGGGFGKLFGGLFADGAAFSGGRVTAFEKGGIVNGMQAFAMQAGLGVMGEKGPEAIMPLARGRNGQLGVMASGGGQSRVEIEITENPMFAARVEGIAEGRAVQVVRKYDRDVAPKTRQRPSRERG